MKKTILILSTVALTACGEEKESVSKDLTYDERVADVCDCFSNSEDPSDCFMLQADHIQLLEDDQVIEFTQATNNCSN